MKWCGGEEWAHHPISTILQLILLKASQQRS